MPDDTAASAAEEFVPVPVPARHVLAVYRFLVGLEDAYVPEVPVLPGAGDPEVVFTPWTVEELLRFATSGTRTSETISAVMDVIVTEPGRYFTTSELADRTDIGKDNMKGAMSALTRHIKAHYPGHAWPFGWEWGPKLGRDYPLETHYRVSAEMATLWKEARKT